MMKILLKCIVSFIGLVACNKEQAERKELEKIARGDYKYTLMSYKVNELSSNQREYCRMPEENFEMFFLLRRRAEQERISENNTRIVSLKYLCGSDSPRSSMLFSARLRRGTWTLVIMRYLQELQSTPSTT